MNTLSTKHPIALTASSLWSAPYYLDGYIEACIEETFPVYVDDSLGPEELEHLEQSVEMWSAHTPVEIIRGEAALAQSQIETLLDFGNTLTFQEHSPAGFRGKIGLLVQREAQVTSALESMVVDGRAFILSSKRWDEWDRKGSHFWKKSFFLPPAWNQHDIRTIKDARAQATGSGPLLAYNTLEWLQSHRREAIVESIKKTTHCMTLDTVACDRSSYVSLLARADKVILETQDPAEINAWVQLCSDIEIPCQPMYGTASLSPMRKLAYGISLEEKTKHNDSLRETLAPTIQLLKEGVASLDVNFKQMQKTGQELRAKRILEILQLWTEKPHSIKAEGAKFFFYTLPQERAMHINPEAWSENGICDNQVWPEEQLKQPKQIEEGFLLLKNHTHWMQHRSDPRGQKLVRQCINAYLFREPNASWQSDFHTIWSQWDGFIDACESAVKAFYAASPRNQNGYTQIAHGILLGVLWNDEGHELIPKIQELIQKDKTLGRYTRITPHEDVILLAFQGNLEQAEAVIAESYKEHEQAFDGYKVLGQWARAYATREQALAYYEKEKLEGRRSQECAIQHALIRSEQEPLEVAAAELESAALKPLSDEAAFIELVNRYMEMRFSSICFVKTLTTEQANGSYIARRLEFPETRQGQSMAALATGLTEGIASGESAFKKTNNHPKHHYYWASMYAAHGEWSKMKAHLQELDASISPRFPIQVWAAAQGLLSSEDARNTHRDAITESIELMKASLLNQPIRRANQYALLAKLYLFSGNKKAALDAINALGTMGSRGWRAQFSSLLTWTGFPKEGAELLNKSPEEDPRMQSCSNDNYFYQVLAHTLLGNKQKTEQALNALHTQSPNYLNEQSAFRQNTLFCEMAIADLLEDNSWKASAKERSQRCDPWFENKNQTWNTLKEKQLNPA